MTACFSPKTPIFEPTSSASHLHQCHSLVSDEDTSVIAQKEATIPKHALFLMSSIQPESGFRFSHCRHMSPNPGHTDLPEISPRSRFALLNNIFFQCVIRGRTPLRCRTSGTQNTLQVAPVTTSWHRDRQRNNTNKLPLCCQ